MVRKMKKILYFISAALISCSVFSLTACGDEKEPDTETTKSTHAAKITTSEPVKIVNIPEKTEDRVEMLNSALDYIDVYCYKYKKNVKCSITTLNVGSLSKVSNSWDAFKSVFGEKDSTVEYDYNTAPESFSDNIITSGFTADDVVSADAKQDGDNIILTVSFGNESNPNSKNGFLYKLSSDYINAEKVKSNLSEFNSSAGSINVSAYDIKITATISAEDSSLKKLVVSYAENFSLGNVRLVQLNESTVTGISKTTETYSDIG